MLYFVYYERFINYFGQARKAEFFIYAVLTVIIICSVSMQFRNIKCPVWLFIMIEAGLLFHFAGGIVHYDSKRLYDHYFFNIRYDKFVHFYNAFTAAVCISFIFSYMKLKLGTLRNIIIFFTVLGLGAMIEIFEYAVAKNITDNGVGLYNNNMQDLISNAAGISFFLIISAVSGKFKLNSLHTAVHEK
jgi:hypothetical protein